MDLSDFKVLARIGLAMYWLHPLAWMADASNTWCGPTANGGRLGGGSGAAGRFLPGLDTKFTDKSGRSRSGSAGVGGWLRTYAKGIARIARGVVKWKYA